MAGTENKETNVNSWTSSEKENSKKKYGCEILIENGTFEEVSAKDYPSDAKIIIYEINGEKRYDLTRGSKVSKIFDMYWDKFREGIKDIQFGNGRINPKMWGYKTPERKKRK